MTKETTFKKITNNDIYDLINSMKCEQTEIKEHVVKTNGKVKLNKWIATTALSLSITLVFLILGFMLK